MEPVILWFERRARRVERETSGKLLRPRPGPQRAAIIQRFCNNLISNRICALSGQAFRQGAFAVSGER